MEYKQKIVEGIAEELHQILGSERFCVQTRFDHGCWEVIIRKEQGSTKYVECTLTSAFCGPEEQDKVYINYYLRHPGISSRVDTLSDPTWIDRFLAEVRKALVREHV